MNFEHKNLNKTLLEDYYESFEEDTRLETRHGQVEFKTACKYIEKHLNGDTSKTILDIGAGTGKYSIYLTNKGYKVKAIELVQHNIDVMKKNMPTIDAIQGNALNLPYDDNSFDCVLLFGPMYHLLKKDEKIQALLEAKRVCKDDGIIFVSYYMNEYAIIKYGFINKHILECKNDGRIDNTFHMVNLDNDLYSMVRIEDINEFNSVTGLTRVSIISQDGPSDYIRSFLNKLSDQEFDEYLKYHFATCERPDLLGASSHVLDIVKK